MEKDREELYVISMKVNFKLLKAIKTHAYEQDRTVSSSIRLIIERELGVTRAKPKLKPISKPKKSYKPLTPKDLKPKEAKPVVKKVEAKKPAAKKAINKQLKIE